MAYQEFAYFYDEFNGAADYDALFAYVTGELKAHGHPRWHCGRFRLRHRRADPDAGPGWVRYDRH